jgi:GDSL-like Lipase/Acylhydrolase family
MQSESSDNQLGQVLGLTVLVAALLLVVSLFSKEQNWMGITLRRMDILSDIRLKPSSSAEVEPVDTLLVPNDTISQEMGTIQAGFVPFPLRDSSEFGYQFEDYTPQQRGLQSFFTALDSIRTHGHKVRVAFYGDSFIEGDILAGDLRDSLQTVWGGDGVGYVPITSEVARYRRTFVQEYRGWQHYSLIHPPAKESPLVLGVDGHVYVPEAEAKVHYKGTTQYGFKHTQRWSDSRLFYRGNSTNQIVWQHEGGAPEAHQLAVSRGWVSVWDAPNIGPITACAIRFLSTDLAAYGVSLENGPGFYLDNFSVRGNSGGKLLNIRPEIVRDFDAIQQYDLVVLQYGLNAAGESTKNIGWYRAELEKTFKHIRACYPHTPILFISVPDRAGKIDGVLTTLPSVPLIVHMQRELARQHGFLFYDFYRGMGGAGSMIELANITHPTLANKDYTHLTHDGGRFMGYKLAGLFLREQARFLVQ